MDRGIEELRDVVVELIFHTWREALGESLHFTLHTLGNLVGVRTGYLHHHRQDGCLAVVLHRHIILQTTQLYIGHILQTQRLTGQRTGDDDILKLLGSLQTTGIAHGIFVCHRRLLTELTWCRLDILFSQYVADVARNESVLLHLVRLQPDTHGVGLHTRAHHITHTGDTLHRRDDVDIRVVGQELVVIDI